MASNYEKPPVFSRDCTWSERDLKAYSKAKFNGPHQKEEVPIYGGDLGMEFLLSKTIPEYNSALERLGWSWADAFDQFERVLEGPPRTAWLEVVDLHPDLKNLHEAGFKEAIALLIKKLLNNATPRDQQWIYMAPGGEKSFYRDILTSPTDHLRRFNEIIRISKSLPAGNIADPSERLQVQWLYMSYHQKDREKYVESGKVLGNETLETLTAYFQAIHDQKVASNTLVRKPQETTKKNDDRAKNNGSRRHSSSRGRSNDRRPDYRDGRYDHRDRDRGRERYRDRRDAPRRNRDDHRSRDGNGRSRTSSSASKTTKAAIANPCHEHSRDGHPARHTWAECSSNPKNKKSTNGDDRRAHEHHHAETRSRSYSRSRSRSPSPWSDTDERRRSSSPSDRSNGSADSEDNFAAHEELLPATKYRGRGKLKSQEMARLDQADLQKRIDRLNRRGYRSLADPIPKKKKRYKRQEDDESYYDSYAADDDGSGNNGTQPSDNPIEF